VVNPFNSITGDNVETQSQIAEPLAVEKCHTVAALLEQLAGRIERKTVTPAEVFNAAQEVRVCGRLYAVYMTELRDAVQKCADSAIVASLNQRRSVGKLVQTVRALRALVEACNNVDAGGARVENVHAFCLAIREAGEVLKLCEGIE